jgi:hypothetical protein
VIRVREVTAGDRVEREAPVLEETWLEYGHDEHQTRISR